MTQKAGFRFRPDPWYLAAIALVLMSLQSLGPFGSDRQVLPYSEAMGHVAAGRVGELTVTETRVHGTFRVPLEDGTRSFSSVRVDPLLAEELARQNVIVTGDTEQTWLGQLVAWVLPALIFVGLWVLLMKRVSGGRGMGSLMSIGKSKAKIYVERDTRTRFEDVAGVDEAKAELQETVAFLRDPETYGRLGARIPKGVLLVGPPGTGKTLLARAVAGEAGVPFFSISGSEFVEMFVGVGAARVRDLFEQAREKAPCIIFVDELDALGRARGAFPGGGHDEKEQTLNQLLVELDGFDPAQAGMVLLAATNRPEILDPALLRAGRFDRQVLVDRPDRTGRVQILHVHMKPIRRARDVDVEAIASLTPGFTGADLATLVNEAALLATRRDADAVAATDFTEAIERIVAGLEKRNRLINPRERRIVAHHEMGHAIVALRLTGRESVHKVSIIPRGIGSLGYTIQRPTEDRYLMTLGELEDRMTVLLAGRAAEILIFGMPSTGASDDLLKATAIARAMVTRYGMDDTLGEMSYEPEPSAYGDGAMASLQPRDHGEATAREIDCAVRDLVSRASARALDLLGSERARLVAGAEALLEQETLSAEELRALVFGSGVPEGDSGRPEQSERNAVERAENEGLATCAPTP